MAAKTVVPPKSMAKRQNFSLGIWHATD